MHAIGVEVFNMNHSHCRNLMRLFIEENREQWNEDIGEHKGYVP